MSNQDGVAAATAEDVAQALVRVRGGIAAACRAAGREPSAVTLVAVSKTVPPAAIATAMAAGQQVFGENRVQEAERKWTAIKPYAADVELHLIGPLQSNKVKDAIRLFDVIHSVDRTSLVAALAKAFATQPRRPRLLVQINTGREPQKAGVAPESADAFLALCRQHYGLTIAGLMCIPPLGHPPEPHFALLARIAARNGLNLLSMGMSADFVQAIALGATHVRIGTAIFGDRRARPDPSSCSL
jgi:pyridoxal phosphate enzyme (YggS family)